MTRIRRVGLTILTILLAGFSVGVASGHEVSGRFEAPLPLELLFGAAGITVGITALMLAFTVSEPSQLSDGRSVFTISPYTASVLRTTAQGLFVAAFVLAIATGLVGKQVQPENFATVFVWAIWLKGVAIIAALVGSPWRVLSPWRAIYDGLVRVEGEPIALFDRYPNQLSIWPALGGYLLWIGIIENLTVIPRSPSATALLLVIYASIMIAGGIAFGPEWFRQADALAVLYRLFERVAPFAATRTDAGGYHIRVRPPWRAAAQSVRRLAVAAFVIAAVYTVSFDGFTSTPEFQSLLFTMRNSFDVGSSVSVLLYLAGFVVFIDVFIAIVGVVQRVVGRSLSEWQAATLAFAPTVLPIAVAYEIAHNYPFVVASVSQLPTTLWPFIGFGQAPTIDLLAWLTLPVYWGSQVLLIVGGHIVAVVAAHSVAFARYETAQAARRAHLPLVVLMIGYTILSLWIISRPVTT